MPTPIAYPGAVSLTLDVADSTTLAPPVRAEILDLCAAGSVPLRTACVELVA